MCWERFPLITSGCHESSNSVVWMAIGVPVNYAIYIISIKWLLGKLRGRMWMTWLRNFSGRHYWVYGLHEMVQSLVERYFVLPRATKLIRTFTHPYIKRLCLFHLKKLNVLARLSSLLTTHHPPPKSSEMLQFFFGIMNEPFRFTISTWAKFFSLEKNDSNPGYYPYFSLLKMHVALLRQLSVAV